MSNLTLNDKLTIVSQMYGEESVLRAAISSIPYVGGALDIMFSSKGQSYIITRIEGFIEELKAQVSHLEESKVNHEFLESEQGFDLIVKAFNSSARTRQREKIKLYAKILKGALTKGKEFEEDEAELYLKIVEELSIKELQVALLLYKLKEIDKRDPEDDNPNAKQDGMSTDSSWIAKLYPQYNQDELISILVRLERTGLIKEKTGSFLGYSGGQYMINALFRRFINFIEKID